MPKFFWLGGIEPPPQASKARTLPLYHSQIILSGRRINDDMGKYVAENVVKKLIAADLPVRNAKVAILGFTFKENCPDTRNTKIIDIYNELGEYGITPVVVDTTADADEAKRLYGITFGLIEDIKNMDAVVVAVAHEEFLKITKSDIDGFFNPNNKIKVLADIKGLYKREDFASDDYSYWRL